MLHLPQRAGIRRRRSSRIVVADSFQRADSAVSLGSADTGQAWTAHGGTPGIAGNQAYFAATALDGGASVESGAANVTVSVVCTAIGGDFGVIARLTDGSNYIRLVHTGGAVFFQKRVGGGFTTFATQAWTLTAGDVFTLACSGNTLTARINGTQIGTTSDAFNNTATRHGFGTNGVSPGTSPVRWKYFRVTAP